MNRMRVLKHRGCGIPVMLDWRPMPRGPRDDPASEVVPTTVLVCPKHGILTTQELDPLGGVCVIFPNKEQRHG